MLVRRLLSSYPQHNTRVRMPKSISALTITQYRPSSQGLFFPLAPLRTMAQVCCDDRAMKKRPGVTVHLSISLPAEEAKILRRRAKRVHAGNVSRVVSDAIRYIAYEEGRDALIASWGGKGNPTPTEATWLDAAWGLVAKKSA
jgi:hypothetical protein